MEQNIRLCGNCCFYKDSLCVMSKGKKWEHVLPSESAAERKCKNHLFKTE